MTFLSFLFNFRIMKADPRKVPPNLNIKYSHLKEWYLKPSLSQLRDFTGILICKHVGAKTNLWQTSHTHVAVLKR